MWLRLNTIRGTEQRHRGRTPCSRPPDRAAGRGGGEEGAGEAGRSPQPSPPGEELGCAAPPSAPPPSGSPQLRGARRAGADRDAHSWSLRFPSHVYTDLGCARRLTGLQGRARGVAACFLPRACFCCWPAPISCVSRGPQSLLSLLSHRLGAAGVFPNRFLPYVDVRRF